MLKTIIRAYPKFKVKKQMRAIEVTSMTLSQNYIHEWCLSKWKWLCSYENVLSLGHWGWDHEHIHGVD